MKKYITLFVIIFFSIGGTAQQANTFGVNLYGGYTFSDRVDYNNSYGRVEDAFEYGAGLEYFFYQNSAVELKYIRMDTHLPLFGPLGVQLNAGDDKGALNYIIAGGTRYFGSSSSKVLPYFGGGLGLGILETPQSGSETNFAFEIRTGVKIKTSSAVSLSLNAYLQSMTAAVGNSYYWTYYGLVGATDYVSTYQFGLGAVMSFNFK